MAANPPIPARIILQLKQKSYSGEAFIGLSTSLNNHGFILGEPRELRRNEDSLVLIVIFSDRFAFENWLEQEAVIQYWQPKFEEFLVSKPVTIEERDVIIEVDKTKNCNCFDSTFYLLDGRKMQFIGGLYCGNCLGHIPNYKIPKKIELEAWLRNYERVYSIWLESSTLEEWARSELSNYKEGELNLEGQKIRKELELFFKKPVYLEYFEEEPGLHENCYICASEGEESGLKKPSHICKKCGSAFGYSE